MKTLILGCAAALTIAVAAPIAAHADDPVAQNTAAAKAALDRTNADLARTKHYTEKAISDSASSQKAAITRSADWRKRHIASSARRRQHAIELAAKARKDRISHDAAAEKKAVDAQPS